jgi:predicted nucleic acid-binding protein
VFLIDTNVVSEARKGDRANRGVAAFFRDLADSGDLTFLASSTIGELRRGVELIRRRGDADQAARPEAWLGTIVDVFGRSAPEKRAVSWCAHRAAVITKT